MISLQENFDIEEYVKENPMDYIKAIALMNKQPSNPVVPETIYQITRWHVPQYLYKYYYLGDGEDLNSIRLRTLQDKKIYSAEPKDFNDPFDGRAFFYRSEELLKYDFLKRWNGKLIDDFSSYVRLASFTRCGVNNMPMWAHYSNNHRGYCVKYDTSLPSNMKLRASMFPVQYINQRIDITPIMDEIVSDLLRAKEAAYKENKKKILISNIIVVWMGIFYNCIKHPSWAYEEEVRYITSSTNDPYMDATPSAIYIGEKCSEVNKAKLIEIANSLGIPAYQMILNEYSLDYEYTSNRIN